MLRIADQHEGWRKAEPGTGPGVSERKRGSGIHGSGPEAWHSATPKAKFVVINLPYRSLTVRRMKSGKKTVEAIYTEEQNELHETSALFFDGKKYKYVPMGSSMED